MNFAELNYVDTEDNPKLAEDLYVKDFMCKHCNRIKMSMDLIDNLVKFKKLIGSRIFVALGYQCKELCEETGENPDNSHTEGKAVDIHFGSSIPIIDVLDVAVKVFPCIGVTKAITGEFYLHVQQDQLSIYWLCSKAENDSDTEYLYFKDYHALRTFILSKPEIFSEVRI